MRASFFQGRFVITADNGLEEIGMKAQDGKLVRIEYVGRARTNDGEKAGKLYFDFVEDEDVK
jgi:hypothetical protein